MQHKDIHKKILRLVEEQKIGIDEADVILNKITSDAQNKEPLAVVGISIKFPETENIDDLWHNLINKRHFVSRFPKERFDLIVKAKSELNKLYQKLEKQLESDPRSFASWLSGIEQFEPEAFGLSEHEAQFMGPSERLFLQTALEGLYQAGYKKEDLKGSRTGVYVAHSPHPAFDYLRLFDEHDERAFISNIPANLGYHLSYTLDLRGPVMTVNTSCASSLTAIHVAKNALRQGDCDTAVVGGINLILFPYWEEDAPDHVVRSPHYRCAPFDASADGIIAGEGVAVVILKRLSDALRDRNHIHAILKGSAMSSDGTSNGMQVPNPDAQSQAILEALSEAEITFDQISLVEAHGAGTPIGDLIEVEGLTKAYRESSQSTGECYLGSIKSNYGHMGDAAGIAGFIKAILSLEKGVIPGLNHFQKHNEQIDFSGSPFVVSAEYKNLNSDEPLRAGVNSIGISGTNVHAVIEEYKGEEKDCETEGRLYPVFISGRSRRALWDQVLQLSKHLEENQDYSLEDILYTLNVRRNHEQARIGIFASSTKDFVDKVARLLSVRTFEKAPDTFFEQGIFLADEVETREESILNFHRFKLLEGSGSDLMKKFLKGNDVSSICEETFINGVMVPLPVKLFNTKRIWPASEEAFKGETDELFFEAKWQKLPQIIEDKGIANMQNNSLWIFFLHEEDERMNRLKERVSEQGAEIIRVYPADKFIKESDQSFKINIAKQDSYERLFEEIGTERLSRLAGIVHGFTFKELDKTMDYIEELEQSQNEGVFSIFCLMKGIIAQNLTHPFQLNVLSSLVEQVNENEEIVPARVTSFGIAKVISQEQPTIASFAIDHDLSGSDEEISKQIFEELKQSVELRKELVSYRNYKRYEKVIERQENKEDKPIQVREGGTYVIAGGTGYLGMQIGKFLSQRANVNIVLLGRTPLPNREDWGNIVNKDSEADEMLVYKLKEIMEMESRGSTVSIMTCDVTKVDDVKETFSKIREIYGSINGVFILVKQLYHLWIKELQFSQFEKGIFNRVKGTWIVEREIASDNIDFFILFSSISSLMGTKSASECCAVNQYLDSMAGYLTKKGVPGRVINWTLILDDQKDFGSKTAIPPIDFVDFHNALNRFFDNGHKWSMVSRFDLEEVRYLKPVMKIPFGSEFWKEVEEYNRVGSQEPIEEIEQEEELDRAEIEARIRQIWKTVIGMESVNKQDNFFSTGGTSLSALRFVQLMKKNFSRVKFQVSDLYGKPTFDAQVKYCEDIYCEKDELKDIFDALENDEISSEEALALLSESGL